MNKFEVGDKLVVVDMKPPVQCKGGADAFWIEETTLQLGDVVTVLEVSRRGSVKVKESKGLLLNSGHFEKVVKKPKSKDPLTIRKITCKSTGLPVSRVREIKKALREVYRRAVEEGIRSNYDHTPAKEQFEKGVRVWDCLTFKDHLDIMDFNEWCDVAFSTEGATQ